MILIFSTLFHLLATIPPLNSNHPFRYAYTSVIITATLLSALWHFKQQSESHSLLLSQEQKQEQQQYLSEGVLLYLDYSFATIWFFYDMGMVSQLPYPEKLPIIVSTVLILCLHQICSAEQNYAIYHSLWHIASAIKCVYVSYKLFDTT
jgi:hypothetical protein